MVNARYCLLSILSGVLWGIVGGMLCPYGITDVWCAVAASPVIGLTAGLLFLPACRWSLSMRIFLSLATLYIAATLFGFAAGVQDALLHGGDDLEVVLENILMIWWGLTLGYFLFLWPLSFVNHTLVCRFGSRRLT